MREGDNLLYKLQDADVREVAGDRELLFPARILVVDDESDLRSLFGDLLREEGYDVDSAVNGKEALLKMEKNFFDLVITDIKMPGLDGIEVLKRVKEIDPDCEVIVVTGHGSIETALESMKLGAADYLTKPLNIDQIKVIAKRNLDKKESIRKSRKIKFYKESSHMDGLTGLYNHELFHRILQAEVSRAERYTRFLSLLMLDIDCFKTYNDNHGHPAGDIILQKIAGIFKNNSRDSDLIAGYGEDEFAIIVPETGKAAAWNLARRIRQRVEETIFEGGRTQPQGAITISVGVASFPEDAADKDDLIERADQALCQAKNSGKNKVVLFNS